MKTIKIVATTIILVIALSACKKVKLPDSRTSELIGKWILVSNGGGWSGETKSDGKTVIEFTKYGMCNVYHNSFIKSRTKYKFIERRSIYSGQIEYIIDYSNHNTAESFIIVGNQLSLNAEAYDAGGKVLNRK